MKFIIGTIISWILATVVFWAIFFKATPALCALVPSDVGAWKGIIDVGIYLIVAGIGGIGLPLGIGLLGTRIAAEL